jgi:hypothetical protein
VISKKLNRKFYYGFLTVAELIECNRKYIGAKTWLSGRKIDHLFRPGFSIVKEIVKEGEAIGPSKISRLKLCSVGRDRINNKEHQEMGDVFINYQKMKKLEAIKEIINE